LKLSIFKGNLLDGKTLKFALAETVVFCHPRGG